MRSATPKTLALGAVVLGAKAATVALRIADGGGQGLASPWAPPVLIFEDLSLILAFGLAEALLIALARRAPRLGFAARAASSIAYAVITAWVALNVPVARIFSTPATFGFLNATGGALRDSAAAYLTPANVLVPLALMTLAAVLPRVRLRPPPARVRLAAGAALVAIALCGSAAASRVATLGLHRNAIVALAATTAAHLARPDGDGRRAAGPCAASDGGAADLRDLRGAARGRNVVWIGLESTAARFLTAYGAARETTPHLSALAQDAIVFDGAYTVYPESIKALYAMLCARAPLPRSTAAQHAQGRAPCAPIATAMAAAGYRTGLFHSGRFAYLGMDAMVRDRGFERLEDGATIGGAFKSSFGVDEASTVRRLLQFVDDIGPAAPFFVVYLPIAGHHPYHAPGDGPRPFAEHTPADAYANDLYAGDAAFGQLRDGLAARGLDQRTLYVVSGDHGEAFFEHEGNFAHSLFLYEENVRVPLFLAAPGLWRGARRASQLASLIDVVPTILDLLGRPAGAGYEGRSLLDPSPRAAAFFTDQGVWQAAVRDGRWKLIAERDSGRAQLFNLADDPAERHDLGAAEPARVRRLRACVAPSLSW